MRIQHGRCTSSARTDTVRTCAHRVKPRRTEWASPRAALSFSVQHFSSGLEMHLFAHQIACYLIGAGVGAFIALIAVDGWPCAPEILPSYLRDVFEITLTVG